MSGNVFPTPTLQWGTLIQDPTASMQFASKEYVDAKVGGIPEAPTDGQTYGRDGATASWVAVPAGTVVSSFNTRTGAVSLALADVTGVGGAPVANAALTGVPTCPTATIGTNTTQLASTAFVQAALPVASSTLPSMDGLAGAGSSLLYSRQDHVHPTDTSRAPIASPAFTGVVTIPAGASIAGYAPLASPAFTGAPSLPTGTSAVTQTVGNNTTALATTAFVQAALPSVPGPATVAPQMDSTAAVGTSLLYARQDHVHPSDTSLLPLAGGTITGNLTVNGNSYVGNSAAIGFPTPTASGQGGLNAYILGLQQASYIVFNGYLGSGPFNYYAASFGAARIGLGSDGTLQFLATSTTGAAGAAITTFANTMALGPTGNLTTWGEIIVVAGGINVTGASTMSGGTTFSGGVNFGSTFASSATNLANQIALYGSTYGITVTNLAVNYVSASGGSHTFYQGASAAVNLGSVSSITGNLTLLPGQAAVPCQVFSGGGVNNVLYGGTPGNGVLATTATVGFPMIPSCAGTPTGAPINGTKACSLVYNTSSHSLNLYDPVAAGWYHIALTAGAG